jgi:hypothetical protein
MPELGNLAWAPLSSVDEVEIFDRFNGVPTLGIARSTRETYLFWRAAFYLDDISLWLYVPLTVEDQRLVDENDFEPLSGIVFGAHAARYTTVGVADRNRLVFEREWWLPAGLTPEQVCAALVDFSHEALTVALAQDPPLPASRRDVVQRASEAVRQLLPA